MTHKLEINGGSPKAAMQIEDVRDERSGFNVNQMKKLFQTGKT